MLFETIMYCEFVDPIFKQKQSVNLIGTLRKPGTKNVKQLLVVSSHHDSALEFIWLRILGGVKRLAERGARQDGAWKKYLVRILTVLFVVITVTVFLGPITMLVMSLVQLSGIIVSNAALVRLGTLGWVMLAYPITPSIIIGLSYIREGREGGTVPGAADDLAASAALVALSRFLVENPAYIPDNTEIRFTFFGSEEAGLRGSRRYVERHLEELKCQDARVLNLEVITHPEILILTTDVTGVKNAPEMVTSATAAAQRAGVPYKVNSNPTSGGGSDAGSFSLAGIKALTLIPFKMPEQMLAFYNQKWDGPEVLTTEPLLNVLKLTFEWIRIGGA